MVAEREGFEPSVELSPHTHLAGERLQPTRPSLRKIFFTGLTRFTSFLCIIYLLTFPAHPPRLAYSHGGQVFPV